MKGSLLWKFMYLFCAMAGILAGYGIFALTTGKENIFNTDTKDNTLVREAGDSVFFDKEEVQKPVISEPPSVTQKPVGSEVHSPTPALMPSATPILLSPTPVLLPPTKVPVLPEITEVPTVSIVPGYTEDDIAVSEDKLPSLGLQWAAAGENVPELPVISVTPIPRESAATEAITYPAKIFGQVPVLNRSDAYVSYFEFAYDLIAMMEPVVSARGMNMNSLLTKFVVKALFCGVDIEKLDINAPIPRRQAALCLWLAAQVLNENGCDTSSRSAGEYVTDISGCSASEKKSIAYLYESGILKGYQVSGQQFYPEEGLKTEAGNNWLSAVKRQWK